MPAPAAAEVEIVERKGLGHPDTICDALAERLSRSLSAFYLARFGVILHHNVDKALLVGGSARPAFGGGEVLEPIEIHLAGRAVTRVGDVRVPVEELAIEGAREWLRANIRNLDPVRHVRIHAHIRPGSADLSELFGRATDVALANDTSFGVGYAPESELEQLTRKLERELDSEAFRDRFAAGGEDVKLMAVREGGRASFSVARAFVGRRLADLDAYFAAKAELASFVTERAVRSFPEIEVAVNAADGTDLRSIYLTVTGTSAEAGDDGQVGRGNRVNGLITPLRPMSLEAAAGKNPVSHVGKLYNLAARDAAEALCRGLLPEVRYAEVFLVSRIGRPIADPALVAVRLALTDPRRLEAVAPRTKEILQGELARIPTLWRRVIHGEVDVY